MSKVTSKLQVTVPKAIAGQYGIRPGDELDWLPAGDAIRVAPVGRSGTEENTLSVEERLRLFDEATERERKRGTLRTKRKPPRAKESTWKPHEIERGWRREDLYTRGFPR
jgi:AbrB family looped-hinge helix DNA binding protein